MTDGTPAKLGYRMPAEWEPHEATWLSWPKDPITFRPDLIPRVEDIMCKMVAALSRHEKVKILVDDEREEEKARSKLESNATMNSNVQFFRIKSGDVWIRDYGPTFLLHRTTGRKAAVKWNFNAWGGKYDRLLGDDIAGDKVVRTANVPIFRPGIIMEGGSFDVNGIGTVLTTRQCLLNPNRNPYLSKDMIERYLQDYLGLKNIIWLDSGIDGDDTDGHVDDFARFVGPRKIIMACGRNTTEMNIRNLKYNWEILKASRNIFGEEFEIGRLPMPDPVFAPGETRVIPASYANFYIGNRSVLLPIFNDRNDSVAIDILADYFPNREIVPIPAIELVYGNGGIHCVTQQEPLETMGGDKMIDEPSIGHES